MRDGSFADVDSSSSQGSPPTGDSGHNSRTPPNCGRCRNHDVTVPLKGHKRYCLYSECRCEKCLMTAKRQKLMAEQTARRRAQEIHSERRRQGLPVFEGVVSPAPDGADHYQDDSRSQGSASSTDAPASRRPTPPQLPPLNLRASKSDNQTWNSILQLLQCFGFSPNTTPLLHIILCEVSPNPSEVYTRILRALEELRRTSPINQQLLWPAARYDYDEPWTRHASSPATSTSFASAFRRISLYPPRVHPYMRPPPYQSHGGVDPFSSSLPPHESQPPQARSPSDIDVDIESTEELRRASPPSENSTPD